jgi:hypothetical protein
VAVNPPLVALAATVMVAGTVTLVLLLAKPTLVPPAGAAALSVTVQLEVPGETTLAGLQLTVLTVTGGEMLSAKVFEPPPMLATRVAV